MNKNVEFYLNAKSFGTLYNKIQLIFQICFQDLSFSRKINPKLKNPFPGVNSGMKAVREMS